MYEEYNLDGIEDTTPEMLKDEEQDVESNNEDVVIPDNNGVFDEDVERDAKAGMTQEFASEDETVTEPFVSVQYNHKKRDFSKEEAIRYIQKGMHTESLRTKLEFLAAQQNTDVNSLVEKIVLAPENKYREHLEEIYGKGSDEVEIGMNIYREKQSDEYRQIVKEKEDIEKKKSVNLRLADEYLNLKAEMPDAPDYADLPDSVIIEAAEEKRDLYSAYLRYLHKEKMKIDAAKNTQEAAAIASSGTMGQNSGDSITLDEMKFLSGLWGR